MTRGVEVVSKMSKGGNDVDDAWQVSGGQPLNPECCSTVAGHGPADFEVTGDGIDLVIRRVWSMPSADTFSIKPIRELLDRWLVGCNEVVDPFARNTKRGTWTNDLDVSTDAQFHLDAIEFLDMLLDRGLAETFDAALLDPPYSPRQCSESYKNAGRKVGMRETQIARIYAECKDRMTRLLKPRGVAITCGWNSMGFGLNRGFQMHEILLVACGGAHHDYLVTVETRK